MNAFSFVAQHWRVVWRVVLWRAGVLGADAPRPLGRGIRCGKVAICNAGSQVSSREGSLARPASPCVVSRVDTGFSERAVRCLSDTPPCRAWLTDWSARMACQHAGSCELPFAGAAASLAERFSFHGRTAWRPIRRSSESGRTSLAARDRTTPLRRNSILLPTCCTD